jgi:hypothetical protein
MRKIFLSLEGHALLAAPKLGEGGSCPKYLGADSADALQN